MTVVRAVAVLVAAAVALLLPGWAAAEWNLTTKGTIVTYDGRSLMIDGKRDLFFSGAIHYPRSPPEMWPKLIKRAKEGGLNAIETYVFWNAHEPEPGKYNFEGGLDLIKYIKMIQDHDMYAIVRIGPFIQAEWNHGSLLAMEGIVETHGHCVTKISLCFGLRIGLHSMCKEPKFGHLRDLHNVIRSYQKAFLTGEHSSEILGQGYEAHTFELPEENMCLSFLSNNNTGEDGTVIFRGEKHYVPSRSVSILAECKHVVYNTKRVFVQHSERSFHTSEVTSKTNSWEMYSEPIPKYHKTTVRTKEPLEQYNQTKDASDYLWYTTSFRLESDDLPFRGDIRPVLQVKSTAHSMIGFANDAFVGSGRGSKQVKGFMFEKPVDLKVGVNHITFLSSTMGMKDSGGELAEVKGGIQECLIQGLNTGTLDLQVNGWGHKAALEGEDKEIYLKKGMGKVQWKPAENDRAATWYKRYFDEPDGDDPVVLDMSSMSKGMIFVNGKGVGRYWTSYRTMAGTPSQALYHIPRPFLKSKGNRLVVFEEELGKPDGILVQTVTRDDICVLLSEHNPAQIKTWDTDGDKIKLIAEDHSTRGTLSCPSEKTIQEVVFASFGNPEGMCGNFTVGTCHTPDAQQVVEKECLGKPSCVLPVEHMVYGADIDCPSTTATLGVQVRCSSEKKDA
ncbi:Beta-galactosidase 12 [Dichanthelium oligosanthes]|uniref:beta-galactosidase n=1 Tax=Dichanthelium oligosanthes TaxID=888268 RepID=A0A1E5VUA4_9POAL|nr:Beta-galactosidase 12 [Dichanthelium oligosanthes]